MKMRKTDRLIELLIKEVEQLWQCEMTTYLNDLESKELDKLLEEWKRSKNTSKR